MKTEKIKGVREANEDFLKSESLKYSLKDGVAYSIMTGAGESFISPFVIKLGASAFQIGLLSSVGNLVSSLSQVISTDVIDSLKKRKLVLLRGVLIQSIIWVFLILNALFWRSVNLTILLFSIYAFSGSFAAPAWYSIMGDLVDKSKRGVFFGMRNRITGFTAFASTLAAGFILNKFSSVNTLLGFSFLFGVAFVARLVSYYYLSKMYEPENSVGREHYFSLYQFVRKMRFNNFGIFVLYLASMWGAISIASPYFTPYLLSELKFDYSTFIIIAASFTMVFFSVMSYWGKLSDTIGNKRIFTITSYLLPLYPLLWLFSKSVPYLVFVNMFGGFVSAGFELTTSNYIYDAITPQKRARCVSYANFFKGIAIFFGTMLGAFLLTHVRVSNVVHSNYYAVFLVSSIMRFFVAIYFLKRIREVRVLEHVPEKNLMLKLVFREPFNSLVLIPISALKRFKDRVRRKRKKVL